MPNTCPLAPAMPLFLLVQTARNQASFDIKFNQNSNSNSNVKYLPSRVPCCLYCPCFVFCVFGPKGIVLDYPRGIFFLLNDGVFKDNLCLQSNEAPFWLKFKSASYVASTGCSSHRGSYKHYQHNTKDKCNHTLKHILYFAHIHTRAITNTQNTGTMCIYVQCSEREQQTN